MAKDEFFSFGDEDVENTTANNPWSTGSDGATATLAFDQPGHQGAVTPPLGGGAERVDEEVQHSRGDSGWDSSEKREPSSLRVRVVVAVVLLVTGVTALRIIAPSFGTDGARQAPSVSASQSSSGAVREEQRDHLPSLAVPADSGRPNHRERSADDQRARRSRTEARRKRKRRRDRSSGRKTTPSGSRESTGSKRGSHPPVHQSTPPPITPATEEATSAPAPPVEPTVPPPPRADSTPELRDGAHSSEFGL